MFKHLGILLSADGRTRYTLQSEVEAYQGSVGIPSRILRRKLIVAQAEVQAAAQVAAYHQAALYAVQQYM